MIDATQVASRLDERLEGLTTVPAEHYLTAGRAARGRRRRRRFAGVTGLAVAGLLAATQVLPVGGGDDGLVREIPAAVAAPEGEVAPPSLSDLTVRAGVGDIDAYSTDGIPEWAKEYGNHGPAAIGPDGRLWVAPGTKVVRSIDHLLDDPSISHSYALEVEWTPHDPQQGGRGLYWWWSAQEVGSTDSGGLMDDAARWTTDFALWAQSDSGFTIDRPAFSGSLVRFASTTSTRLVAQPGVEIVDQVTDVDTGDMEQYARRSAAQVVIDGHTYFVLANGRAEGKAFYEPYEAAVVGGDDLASFEAFVANGFEAP